MASAVLLAPVLRSIFARPWRLFAVIFVPVLLICLSWTFATPRFAAPDEPAHVIKAAAVDSGQLIGTTSNPSSPVSVVQVPALYRSSLSIPGCFVHKAALTPACAPPLSRDVTKLATSIQNGRYPPLYYWLVGVPSLFATSPMTIWWMRIVSTVAVALFLSLALFAALWWSARAGLLVGLVVALTPEVLFFSGVVNPSSLEIGAAICLWTCGTLIVFEHRESTPTGLVAITVGAACVEACMRGLSLLWVALCLLGLALLAGRNGLVALSRQPRVRVGVGVVLVVCGLALAWILGAHALDVQQARAEAHGASFGNELGGVLERQGWWLRQMIGEFNWESTPAPFLSYLAWFVVGFGLFVLTIWRASGRHRVIAVSFVILSVAIPVAIVLSQYQHLHGIVWQGKDGAPLVLGVPIVLGAMYGLHRPTRLDRPAALVALFSVSLAQIFAFAIALSRFTNGTGASFSWFANASWEPPIPAAGLFDFYVVLVLGAAAWFWVLGSSIARGASRPTVPVR